MGDNSSQWASELPHVQYSKNAAFHSGINCTPFCAYFGRKPGDHVADLTLPSEGGVALVRISKLSQVRIFLVVTSQNCFFDCCHKSELFFSYFSQVGIIF